MEALGLTEDQLRERRSGVGGSDIAAVLGVDPYRSPWNVFAEKLGLVAPKPPNRFTRWGHRLESAIAAEYEDVHDVHLERCATLRHHERAWQIVTPDRLVFLKTTPGWGERASGPGAWRRADYGLEIKNKGFFQAAHWGEDGADESTVPEEVAAQAHWSMALTERPRWDVATLIGGNDYRQFTIPRDLEMEALLLEVGERFWRDHVLKREPPPYDGSEVAWAHLAARFKPTAKPLPVDEKVRELGRAIRAARQLIAAASEGKETHEQELAALIVGAGCTFTDGDDFRFTVGERRGSPAWKAVAMALVERYNVSPETLNDLEAQHRGPTQITTRWTDRTKEKSKP